ncbi:DNA-binding response OmpR family regulator [Aurantimicrobium minutum]|uniref:response regulator transcription factor n=1 Tax=Aurantimicrobium minutum TaxID=708131 RepID=UPI002406750D|nr:response regulator transcription factor [Aurantimicrobium minutum]MDF9809357.1 DNA-binding response OmpR family regulator [Aurantimicrobium minutum]
MRVLLVEDDQSVADGLLDGLSGGTFETRHVSTGAAALEALSEFSPEIVLLDLGLPDIDGTEVCRKIRTVSAVPIIVVSARDEEIDRVVALEIGADDYVVKPFGMRELIARIRAVVRRTGSSEYETPIVNERVFGNLIIDVRTQKVSLAGVDIHVTAKEFELLEYLSSDPGAVFKRSDILHDVWDTNWYGTSKTLDAHIAAIRKKLGNAAWIESVRGVGFRLGQPS